MLVLSQSSSSSPTRIICCGEASSEASSASCLNKRLPAEVQLGNFVVSIRDQHITCTQKRLHQLLNLRPHMGQLHLERGHFGITRGLTLCQCVKFPQLADHLIINENLQLRRFEVLYPFTSFVMCAYYTAGRIYAPGTLHLSSEPCPLNLSCRLEPLVCQCLAPAGKPHIRRNNPFVRGKNKGRTGDVVIFTGALMVAPSV